SKLPITWMSAEAVVEAALKSLGRKAFVIPGLRNHLMACLSGGLRFPGLVQRFMEELARLALPVHPNPAADPPRGRTPRPGPPASPATGLASPLPVGGLGGVSKPGGVGNNAHI